jgi:hypothetical protein
VGDSLTLRSLWICCGARACRYSSADTTPTAICAVPLVVSVLSCKNV